MERRRRSIAKTISFRIIATITTFALVWLFTKDLTIATTIGIIEFVAKLAVYYVHERFWNKTSWGKK